MRLSVLDTETAVADIALLAYQRAVEVLQERQKAVNADMANEDLKKRLNEAQTTVDELADLIYRVDTVGEKVVLMHEVKD